MKNFILNQFNSYMMDIFNPYPIHNGLSLYQLLIFYKSDDIFNVLNSFQDLFKK